MVVGLEHHGFAVPDDGHAVVALAGQPPDQRAVAVGDVDDSEAGAGVLQNAPLHDAERTPGKLNEFNHVIQSSPLTASFGKDYRSVQNAVIEKNFCPARGQLSSVATD